MARSSYAENRSLPDPLFSYNFDLVIPNVPGGGDGRMLKLKCMSTSIPGVSLDDVEVTLHGATSMYAGREIYTHTLQATFLETRDLSTRDALNGWIAFARSARTNTGTYKVQYATDADLLLYDDTGSNVIRTIRMEGFYCKAMDDAAVDGSSSTAVTIGATFSYDLHYDL